MTTRNGTLPVTLYACLFTCIVALTLTFVGLPQTIGAMAGRLAALAAGSHLICGFLGYRFGIVQPGPLGFSRSFLEPLAAIVGSIAILATMALGAFVLRFGTPTWFMFIGMALLGACHALLLGIACSGEDWRKPRDARSR